MAIARTSSIRCSTAPKYLPHSVSASNYGNYEDPAEIELYDRMLRETDFARQRQLMQRRQSKPRDNHAVDRGRDNANHEAQRHRQDSITMRGDAAGDDRSEHHDRATREIDA